MLYTVARWWNFNYKDGRLMQLTHMPVHDHPHQDKKTVQTKVMDGASFSRGNVVEPGGKEEREVVESYMGSKWKLYGPGDRATELQRRGLQSGA